MASTTSMEGWDCSMQELDAEVVDRELLMELLEDSYDEEVAEDERLGYVMRSLEEEISDGAAAAVRDVGDGESTTGPVDDGGACGLMEDLLSDLDSEDISRAFVVEDPFDWVDMDMAACSGAGHDMDGGWFSDVEVPGDDEVVGYGEAKDYLAMYYGQLNVEQVYSPLWQ